MPEDWTGLQIVGSIAAVAAGLLTLLGGIGLALMHYRRVKTERLQEQERLALVERRLDEVRAAAARQESLLTRSRWSSSMLVVGQYIIGGLLATTFAQAYLAPSVVGFLGLLVLTSALLREHFDPAMEAVAAAYRLTALRGVLRNGENLLVRYQYGSLNDADILNLAESVSDDLYRLEMMELDAPTELRKFQEEWKKMLPTIASSRLQTSTPEPTIRRKTRTVAKESENQPVGEEAPVDPTSEVKDSRNSRQETYG